MDDFNHSFADALNKLGIKVTDDEGKVLSKEDFVDYLDREGMVYKSIFETDSVWMTAEDEKGALWSPAILEKNHEHRPLKVVKVRYPFRSS